MGRRFDLCLIANNNWRYRLIPLTALCSERRSLRGRGKQIPGRWHGDEYRRLALGLDTAFDEQAPLARLRTHKDEDIMPGEAPVVLVPGGARNILRSDAQRRWPVDYYREVAKALRAQGIPVALAGSGDDRWAEKHFADLEVTSFIGKTNLLQLLALLRQARACVTHDTGPLHLAYLTGTPTVALFGPTLAREKVPPSASVRVISASMPCAPCYDGYSYTPCLTCECMRSLSPFTVLHILRELLQDNK